MSAHLARAARQPGVTRSHAERDERGRAALTSWLLGENVQVNACAQTGAVAGSIDGDGNASYVYPEITGYYLQWLAWHAFCHGASNDTRRRAGAAQQWLSSWARSSETPETRIYLEASVPDWRNSALFFFDLAMVLRGLASATQQRLIEVEPELVARVSELLLRLVAGDGMFDACVAIGPEAQLPDRWSTRRGPFLAKAAGGVLTASSQLGSLPGALVRAADATFAASVASMPRNPHGDTHALLYGIEGTLCLPDHPASVAGMPHVARQLRALLDSSLRLGHVPESLDGNGRMRLDIVAQAVRAAILLLPELTGDVGQMRQMLVDYIEPRRGIPFSPTDRPGQYNVWTAMFAEQALHASRCDPREPSPGALSMYLV
jgi:hypothetical protein